MQITLTLRTRTDDLPPAAKRLLAEAARPFELWDRFPPTRCFATAGRLDPAALLEVLGDFQTKEARAALADALERSLRRTVGQGLRSRVAAGTRPRLRPVFAGAGRGRQEALPHALLAIRLRSDKGADAAVLSAVDFYARLAVVAYGIKARRSA